MNYCFASSLLRGRTYSDGHYRQTNDNSFTTSLSEPVLATATPSLKSALCSKKATLFSRKSRTTLSLSNFPTDSSHIHVSSTPFSIKQDQFEVDSANFNSNSVFVPYSSPNDTDSIVSLAELLSIDSDSSSLSNGSSLNCNISSVNDLDLGDTSSSFFDTDALDNFELDSDQDYSFRLDDDSHDYDNISGISNHSASLTSIDVTHDYHPLSIDFTEAFKKISLDNHNGSIVNNKEEDQTVKSTITRRKSFIGSMTFMMKSTAESFINFPTESKSRRNSTTSRVEEQEKDEGIELQTFKITYKSLKNPPFYSSVSKMDNAPSEADATFSKPRHARLNSNFFRYFAIDNSFRSNLYPQLGPQQLELYYQEYLYLGYKSIDAFVIKFTSPIADESDEFFEFQMDLKIGLLSKDRLWSQRLLPPSLTPPIFDDKTTKYIKLNSRCDLEGDIFRNQGRSSYPPWQNLDNFQKYEIKKRKQLKFKPFGVLNNNIQYTVKGWCNERWIGKPD